MVEDKKENQMLSFKGSMRATLTKADSSVIVYNRDNLIVNAGFDLICASLGNGSRPALLSHIAVGTGATAAVAGNTGLQIELSRIAAAYAHTLSTKVFTMSCTFGVGVGTGALTEAGVFNAASAGTMLDRVVFPVINKGASDTLGITFTFTLA
jgi:hypothetical protein